MADFRTSSLVGSAAGSGVSNIDALVAGTKWGAGAGIGATVSYSFPWTTSGAYWYEISQGEYSQSSYGTLNEPDATYKFGLSATQAAAARSAIQTWANVANIQPQEVAETEYNVGDIRFAWTSASNGDAWGWAYYPTSNYAPGGDIWLSTTITDTNWSAGSYNFEALMHEVGHALGLKHPGYYGGSYNAPFLPASLDSRLYSIMSYTDAPHDLFRDVTNLGGGSTTWVYTTVAADTPMVLDIAAMQYLYGANTTFHASDDVYTFSPSTPFFRTLWDAGGRDTISVSNFTQGSTIDLTPGSYSSIRIPSDPLPAGGSDSASAASVYDGTNNLGIAYGAIIENATGGSGNDTLTGNSADNVLDGGAGADTMRGGSGNDTYVVDSAVDIVTENSNEGSDLVLASLNYTLLANAENLTLTGSAVSAVGNSLANVLTGNALNNTLNGGGGNDILHGGEGIDTAVFSGTIGSYSMGTRDSSLIVSGADGVDVLDGIENLSFGSGTPVAVSSLSLVAMSVVPLITVTRAGVTSQEPAAPFSGTPIAGVRIDYQFFGVAAGEVVVGTDSNDFLNLLAGDDATAGGAGADILDGGTGSNFLSGGAGTDTFFLDGRSGSVTWSTITDWTAGEQLSVWGWNANSRVVVWRDDGAAGYTGITMHADLNNNGTIDTSVTWTGQTQASLPTPGQFAAQDLLWFT